jgi:hypothetical protein
MSEPSSKSGWSLRDLPVSAKLTVAAFLLSVGVGYVAAIVQLHFKHASPGSLMPSAANCVKTFHGHTGDEPVSKFEQLLMAGEDAPFSANGQMVWAFTTRCAEPPWKQAITLRATKMARKRGGRDPKPTEADLAAAEKVLREERMGERDAIIAWVKDGGDGSAFDDNRLCLPEILHGKPITRDFLDKDKDGPFIKLKDMLTARCIRCHMKGGDDAKAAEVPFENMAQMRKYLKPEKAQPMSLDRLAQTTHAHLLAFAMLYGLTGILLALSPLPGWIKVPLAPLPLIVQVIDISCWWLARIEGDVGVRFAEAIPVTGAIVAVGLVLQIMLVLLSMFRGWGWFVLAVLFAGATYGAYVAKTNVIDPFIEAERPPAVAPGK